MGIFDFFRAKRKLLEETGAPAEKEKISFDELAGWIEKQKKQSIEKERAVIKLIRDIIKEKSREIEEKNKLLGQVDLKDKKEQEKLKIIVLENVSNYSYYAGKLIESMKNIEKESAEELIADINRIYSDFKQKSRMAFEKATILVGKEISDVKDGIAELFRELNRILEENKGLIQESKMIKTIEKKAEEIQGIMRVAEGVEKEILEIENKAQSRKEEIESAKADIEKIKRSEEYLSYEREREKAKIMKEEVEKESFHVRAMVGLKSLAKNFHADNKKMAVIKNYEQDSSLIFNDDKKSEILSMLDDAKRQEVQKKVSEIAKKKEEVQSIMARKDKLAEIAAGLISLASTVKNLDSEKQKNKKRIEKLEEDVSSIKKQISQELSGINKELIF